MKVEPGIDVGLDQCGTCTMVISDVDHGAVAIDADEEMQAYCSPVCYLLAVNKSKGDETTSRPTVYLFDHNDMTPVLATNAFIVHGDFPTAMGHGLLAFAQESDATSFASGVNGSLISWDELRLQHEKADHQIELSKALADDPPAIEVSKGDIVEVSYDNRDGEDREIILTGYGFQMPVGAGLEAVGSFVASKPGQGFVFQDEAGNTLTTLFVTGDHTAEEADYR
jgi:nitrous oxide reductase accessory protein NosL